MSLVKSLLFALLFLATPAAAQTSGWEFPTTSSVTVGSSDNGKILAADNVPGASITVTLPNPATVGAGWLMGFSNGGGHGIIVNPPVSTYVLTGQKTLTSFASPSNTNYEYFAIQSDGTNFRLLVTTYATALFNGIQGPTSTGWRYLFTTAYGATVADNGSILTAQFTGAPTTITLPSTGLIPNGYEVDIYPAGQNVTIVPNGVSGGTLIDPQGNAASAFSIPGTGGFWRVLFDGASFRVVPNTFSRTILTAATTFYVNGNGAATAPCGSQTCQPGSDSNNCQTISSPCQTLQHTLNVVSSNYDFDDQVGTIQASDGTYNECPTFPQYFSSTAAGRKAHFSGNAANHDNVVVNCTSGKTITGINNPYGWYIEHVKLTGNSVCLFSDYHNSFYVKDVDFGACTNIQAIASNTGAFIEFTDANSVITGSSSVFADAVDGGEITFNGVTITGSSSLTYGTCGTGAGFVLASSGGIVDVSGATFSGFSGITGTKYCFTDLFGIITGGSNPVLNNILPGNAVGVSPGYTLTTTIASPTGTTSGSQVMAGLGSTCFLATQNSTKARVTFTGILSNTTATDGALAQIRFGSGTAPINGAAATGTAVGNTAQATIGANNALVPFSMTATLTGLTPGTVFWLDLGEAAITGGTASIQNPVCAIDEVF